MISSVEYIISELPIRILLPDNLTSPELYEYVCGNFRISNTMYSWLEGTFGIGTESVSPIKVIVAKAKVYWAVEEIQLEPSKRFKNRQFAIRFRNEEDATLFKLTWA